MTELPTRHLEPCPKCQGQMVFKGSDEFEGAVNLRCTKCWLRYDCNENHRATAAKLWNASQPQVSAQPQVDEERARAVDALDYLYATTCLCTAAGKYMEECDKHGMQHKPRPARSLASPEGVEP